MLFNSIEFLFLFFPVCVLGYWVVRRGHVQAGVAWLTGCSLFFYAWWNPRYLPLILGSAAVNYLLGRALARGRVAPRRSKVLLAAGLTFNLGLLCAFKYTDFLVQNANAVLGTSTPLPGIVLPLAISFFTFQQISFLVDSWHGQAEEHGFLTYLLFVVFFPQLIAGPIVHHRQMMPQFDSPENGRIDYDNLARGLFLLAIGLFKKVVIADRFAVLANAGYADPASLTGLEAWMASLSYSLQLYFDFSAYCDMGMGAALFFNITLPVNFRSPYKATDIQDFWRRWHITLSEFLRDYLYVPLGGNRGSQAATQRNVMITFLLGGIWHGAGWQFLVWGALHGAALVVLRAWRSLGVRLPRVVAWVLTFGFVNAAWVYFRADTITDANRMLGAMFGANGWVVSAPIVRGLPWIDASALPAALPTLAIARSDVLYVVAGLVLCLVARNSIELEKRLVFSTARLTAVTALLVWAIVNVNRVSEFIYFNF